MQARSGGSTGARDIGLLPSGDIDRPVREADTLVVQDGIITPVCRLADCDVSQPTLEIDARRTCVAPGLTRPNTTRAAAQCASNSRRRPRTAAKSGVLRDVATGWPEAATCSALP
jgi:hypothetical protein